MQGCRDCERLTGGDCGMHGPTIIPVGNEFRLTPSEPPVQTPHRCPVCGGNGLVPNGFYMQTSGAWGSTSTDPETCRSCTGTGIVWR